MKMATYNPDNVPGLAAMLNSRADELKPFLNGLDDFVCHLQKLPDRSKLDIGTLYSIACKKSERRAALVRNNDPYVVEKVTELAFSLSDDTKPLQLLCVLDGINVPTASSVLSWMFPDKWPVIDQRAWRTLFNAGVVTSRPEGTGLGFSQWRVYVSVVRDLQHEVGDLAPTPQRVDRLLYALDVLKGGAE